MCVAISWITYKKIRRTEDTDTPQTDSQKIGEDKLSEARLLRFGREVERFKGLGWMSRITALPHAIEPSAAELFYSGAWGGWTRAVRTVRIARRSIPTDSGMVR